MNASEGFRFTQNTLGSDGSFSMIVAAASLGTEAISRNITTWSSPVRSPESFDLAAADSAAADPGTGFAASLVYNTGLNEEQWNVPPTKITTVCLASRKMRRPRK